MLKKISIFLLIGCMVFALFSCSDKNGKQTDNGERDTRETTVGDPTQDPYYPTLESGLNYNGQVIRILQRSERKAEMFAEEYNNEIINDAIYDRNLAVEELLNVSFEFYDVTGSNTTYEAAGGMREELLNSLNAGANDCYHIVSNYAAKSVILVTQGVYVDFHELERIDLTRGWWDSGFAEAASYNGKLYSLVGAANPTATENLFVCFVNFDLAERYFDDVDYYQTVFDGEWTYERLLTDVTQIGNHEDNGGYYGLGLGYNSVSADGWLAALDVKLVEKNSQGIPTMAMQSDRNYTICDSLKKLYNENAATISDYNTNYGGRAAFNNGNAVFYINTYTFAKNYLANASFHYGIMPLPMWEEGDGYQTTPQNEYSCFSVMANLPKDMYDAVGAVLEALAYESYETVHPAIFEKAYKLRYSGENLEASKMFDLLVENRVYDFGTIYSNAIERPLFVFRNYIVQNQSGLADKVIEKNFDTKLTDFLTYFN